MDSKNINSAGPAPASDFEAAIVSRKPSRFSIAALVVLVSIVFAIAAGIELRPQRQGEAGAKPLEGSLPTVAVVFPKPGQSGSGLSLPAEVKPWVEAPIYARANGYLKRRHVDIGSHVKEGQLLAEIDTPELEKELDRARSQLAQAEAALGISRITATRWAGLLKTASVSEQENAEKQADLQLKTATADSARAEAKRLEKLHSFARVTAPFEGIVTVRNIDSGDLIVAAGGKELFHLAQTKKLRVFVQVPQAMARNIHTGQSAEMTLSEIPGKSFPAGVIRTAGVISQDSRTLLVELEVDNFKEEILAGSYAQVRFGEAKMPASLTLPSNTLLFRAEGPQIGVVKDGGQVELRRVKLGRDFGQTIEVLTGVDAKDKVIVNPSESLVTGALVTIGDMTKSEKGQGQ